MLQNTDFKDNKMDTTSLRLFVLAAEKLNISAAGRALGMAPAVASGKLAKLESTVGADLLHRSTRKVALSLEGAEFLPFAREIIAQEDAAKAALGHGKATVTGRLRFAAPSSFAQIYIAPLLPDFLERHPGIDLDLRLSDTQFDLIEGSFDLALRKARKLADDRRILCASPGYLEKHGTPSTPEDLRDHQLIAFRDQTARKLIGPAGRTGDFDPKQANCRVTVDDGLSQKIATLAGAGISMNSLWSVHPEISDGSLVQVLPGYQIDNQAALWLVYPSANVLTAKVRVFIDFLVDRIGRSPAWEQVDSGAPKLTSHGRG